MAVICFGSFAVPAKWASVRAANVHPLVYQTYKTFWCFATSWLALLVPGVQLVFTPFGVLSAVAWVPAGTLAIASIGYAGLGTAQATWSSMIVIISFLWGSVFFQERVDSWPLAASAVAVMCLGIVGMAIFSDPERQRRKARASPTQSPSLLAVADAPLLDVADGGPPLALLPVNDAPATPPPTRRRRAVGIGIALASGTYGGSFAVPLKLAQRAAPDTPAGFEFVVSFGIGAVAVTAVCWALYLAIGVGLLGWRWPSLHVHDGVMIVPGAVAGLAWSAGNMASLARRHPPRAGARVLRLPGLADGERAVGDSLVPGGGRARRRPLAVGCRAVRRRNRGLGLGDAVGKLIGELRDVLYVS